MRSDMAKYREQAQVLEQQELAPGIFSIWLQTQNIAKEATAGQFVSVYCQDGSRLLPRPISLCEVNTKDRTIRLVYRVVGGGTREFSGLRRKDTVDIVGPLGNGFPLGNQSALLIGGGIGIPPLLELAKRLEGETTIVVGYRDNQLFLKEELERCGRVIVATEDGSEGIRGTVIDAICESGITPQVIYSCGPTPMLRAVKQFAAERQVDAWLSLEERMACGVGACLACVCRTTHVDEHSGVKNARICKEGPVFEAREVEL